MKKFWLSILIFIQPETDFAQVKFLNLLDTNYISNDYLNDTIEPVSFYSDARLDEEFNPLDADIELLNAGLYAAIQKERKRKAKKILSFSIKQNTLCKNFLDFYVPDRFENDEENLEKFGKTTKKALKKIKFPKGITKVVTFKMNALDFKGNNFYYLKSATETELKLFIGKKPEGLDSVQLAELEKKPVKTFTYREFIENVMKNYLKKKYSKMLFGNEYSTMACYFKIDQKTLNRNKIPQVAFMMMYGADRLKLMDVAVAKSKKQKKLI